MNPTDPVARSSTQGRGEIPTEKQTDRLRMCCNAVPLSPRRSDWKPLLRRGWVEPISEDDGSRYLPPLRLTVAGWQALARGVEAHGHLIDWDALRIRPRQLDELPEVTELKGKLDWLKSEKAEMEREIRMLRRLVAGVERIVKDWDR